MHPILYYACPSHSAACRLSVGASLARGKAHGLCDTVAGPHSARPKRVFSPLNPVLTRRNDPRPQNSQNPPNFWFYFTFSDGCRSTDSQLCLIFGVSVAAREVNNEVELWEIESGATSWLSEVVRGCLVSLEGNEELAFRKRY